MQTNFNNKNKFFYDGLFPDNTLTDCTCTDVKRSRKNNISLINKQYQTQIKSYSISNSYIPVQKLKKYIVQKMKNKVKMNLHNI